MARYLGFKLKRLNLFKYDKYPHIETQIEHKPSSYYCHLLKEKQKYKYYYNLTEKQIKQYLKLQVTNKIKEKNIMYLLEKRLDIILLRSKFASSIREARHLISYGHIFVNQKQIKIPSFLCNKADFITLHTKSSFILENIKTQIKKNSKNTQKYLIICPKTCRIFIKRDINFRELPLKLNNNLILKYYYKLI